MKRHRLLCTLIGALCFTQPALAENKGGSQFDPGQYSGNGQSGSANGNAGSQSGGMMDYPDCYCQAPRPSAPEVIDEDVLNADSHYGANKDINYQDIKIPPQFETDRGQLESRDTPQPSRADFGARIAAAKSLYSYYAGDGVGGGLHINSSAKEEYKLDSWSNNYYFLPDGSRVDSSYWITHDPKDLSISPLSTSEGVVITPSETRGLLDPPGTNPTGSKEQIAKALEDIKLNPPKRQDNDGSVPASGIGKVDPDNLPSPVDFQSRLEMAKSFHPHIQASVDEHNDAGTLYLLPDGSVVNNQYWETHDPIDLSNKPMMTVKGEPIKGNENDGVVLAPGSITQYQGMRSGEIKELDRQIVERDRFSLNTLANIITEMINDNRLEGKGVNPTNGTISAPVIIVPSRNSAPPIQGKQPTPMGNMPSTPHNSSPNNSGKQSLGR